jgi:hypothetical protein
MAVNEIIAGRVVAVKDAIAGTPAGGVAHPSTALSVSPLELLTEPLLLGSHEPQPPERNAVI